jgi:hypothetical protein
MSVFPVVMAQFTHKVCYPSDTRTHRENCSIDELILSLIHRENCSIDELILSLYRLMHGMAVL